MDTMTGTNNFVAERLLDGNVTLNLVIICFAVASIAVGITLWAVYRFQTKDDAREAEIRLAGALASETKMREASIESVHKHMHSVREELRGDLGKVQSGMESMRDAWTAVRADVSYIKGKLEPR